MTMHSNRSHSTIGASSASRWWACPGSVRLAAGVESKSSVYAEEGTKAHELAESLLRAGTWETDDEAVQVYLDAVKQAIKDAGPDYEFEIENRFALHLIDEDAYGTNDAMIYSPERRHLHILDYKHGAGVPVEAEGNKQLLYYALGAATAKHNRPLETITMTIVQPRCEHPDGYVRSWTVGVDYLLEWAGELKEAVERTKDPNAPLVSGEHCRWCPAKGFCEKYRNDAIEAARMDFSDPSELSPVELADLLEKATLIENWIRDVRAYAYDQAMAGNPPRGMKLVAKRPTRKWVDEKGVGLFMHKRGFENGDIYEFKLKSPAQIEKLLDKQDRDFLDTFVVKESSGLTLVPAHDKRPAVTPDAASDFEALDG